MQLSRGYTACKWHGPEGGPVVVLIHGLTTPSFVWNDILPHLTSAGLRVLTYDHYGRGGSDAPFGRQNMDFFTSHLSELLDACGLCKPIHLVGYSMGGGIVAGFGLAYPDRVASITMIAPIGFSAQLGWLEKFAKMPVLGDTLMQVFGPKRVRSGARSEAVFDGASAQITELQCKATRSKGFARSVLSSMRHVISAPLDHVHKHLAKKDTPICAIWAEDDTVIPLSGAEQLKRINPSVETHFIQDARHGVAYTHSAQVAKIIVDFLS